MTRSNSKKYRIAADATVSNIDLDREEFTYRGERLTEERAEAVAAEALRSGRTRNLIPGRKSLSGDGAHSPTVQYRVPAALRLQVERAAQRQGLTVSKLGRLALEEYLERHPESADS